MDDIEDLDAALAEIIDLNDFLPGADEALPDQDQADEEANEDGVNNAVNPREAVRENAHANFLAAREAVR